MKTTISCLRLQGGCMPVGSLARFHFVFSRTGVLMESGEVARVGQVGG